MDTVRVLALRYLREEGPGAERRSATQALSPPPQRFEPAAPSAHRSLATGQVGHPGVEGELAVPTGMV